MKSFKELIGQANNEINSISVEDLAKEINQDNIVVIDVQSKDDVEKTGMIPGAIHAERGMLEFYADQSEDNPFRKSEMDPNKKIVVYCGVGGQGALSAKTLKDMGFKNVSNLKGGVKAWKESGQKTT
ncbi:rhodanese-like domain-containing protein [Alphaproteobacteria bacterium]|nr:rhodanese-like domain-containing protein [Alphaproteobacteria bacterium]